MKPLFWPYYLYQLWLCFQINDYNRIFACSDVAVIEKEWLLKCFSQNKLVSILPYLLHRATEEELRRLDYGELL